jgi:hypothetical protein
VANQEATCQIVEHGLRRNSELPPPRLESGNCHRASAAAAILYLAGRREKREYSCQFAVPPGNLGKLDTLRCMIIWMMIEALNVWINIIVEN